MINRAVLLKLTIIAAVVCVVGAGVGLLAWNAPVAGGVLLGGSLGVIPFLSWAYIANSLEASPRRKALAAVLLVGKIGIYGTALYVFVTRNLVNPVGVMVGLLMTVFVYITGSLMLPRPAEVRP